MKDWKTASEIELAGKNVIIRCDLEWESINCPRQQATEKIVEYVKLHGGARVKVIGHKGHWETGIVEVENDLRRDPREEANDESLARELAEGFDVYINEAFATSHRAHASIDALPRWMKQMGKTATIGLRFEKEIETLDTVFEKAGKKILVIGGAKAGDKEKASIELASKFDAVLKGGLLTGVKLRPDGLDISDEAIEEYKRQIADTETIVVAGPLGKYEDINAEKGTKEVFEAIASSTAYKIAGGGDTEAALAKFGLKDRFDWISVGGGAMLEYLVKGTLPGLDAVSY